MSADRRAVVSIVGAVLVLLLVTVIIVVFGVIPLPEFASLADQPDSSIPGTVAFVGHGDEYPYLYTVPAAGGAPTTVWRGGFVEFPAWSPEGLLVVTDWSADPAYVVIDPVTGTEMDRIPISDQRPEPTLHPIDKRRDRADGARVFTDGRNDDDEAKVLVRLGTGELRTILSVAGVPSDYHLYEAQWSPDGEWVLVTDSAGRLLIIGANGTPGARVLVEDLEKREAEAAWYIPGNDTYTVEVKK